MNDSRFFQIEERIRQLVEGGFARLFAGRLHAQDVARHLLRALEDHAYSSEDGTLNAPNVFAVRLNPDDYTAILEAEPLLPHHLCSVIVDLAHHADMRLERSPQVDVLADTAIARWSVEITARCETALQDTQAMRAMKMEATAAPLNAQLLLPSAKYVPLDRPVINIGRRAENQIIVDDPRVSRFHAQIRLRHGRYTVFDLNSKHGTFVNNYRVQEYILKPGDVISLGGVPLVYVEDEVSTGSQPTTLPEDRTKTEPNLRLAPRLRPRDSENDPTR